MKGRMWVLCYNERVKLNLLNLNRNVILLLLNSVCTIEQYVFQIIIINVMR